MRPFFLYFGGKWLLAKHYPDPAGRVVVEPFAGAAGYSVRWGVPVAHLLDKDPTVIGVWQYLIHVRESEIRALPLIRPGQDVRDLDVIPEARDLIGWWLNKATTRPSRTLSAWGRNPEHAAQFWGENIRDRVARQVGQIRGWTATVGDFADAPDLPEAVTFVDPPYVVAGTSYTHRFTEYGRLAGWCRERSGEVVVCEGPGADWLPFTPHRIGKATSKGHGAGAAVTREFIWHKQGLA